MKNPSTQRVTVTVDRLVLRGFSAAQRDGIAAGLIAELQSQFGDPATARQFGDSRSLASVRADPLALTSTSRPQHIGAQAGRQLARSIRS
jgi:hypothetical protein